MPLKTPESVGIAKDMKRVEVIVRVLGKALTVAEGARILGYSERHLRRTLDKYRRFGVDGLRGDKRLGGSSRRVPAADVEAICGLKRTLYGDFSIQHFFKKYREVHGGRWSYSTVKNILQAAGLCTKAEGRGKYRRKRERKAKRGMMVHLDASRHVWFGHVALDLMCAVDDATGEVLHLRLVPEDNTHATLVALRTVCREYGVFGALYSDRGSHFGHTPKAGERPVETGPVSRACKAVGIEQIFAFSPEARGRSERMFETLQGRLPQELRLAGIEDIEAANRFLES